MLRVLSRRAEVLVCEFEIPSWKHRGPPLRAMSQQDGGGCAGSPYGYYRVGVFEATRVLLAPTADILSSLVLVFLQGLGPRSGRCTMHAGAGSSGEDGVGVAG